MDKKVIEIFENFLYLDLVKHGEQFSFIVSHPFTSSEVVFVDGELIKLDKVENIDRWRKEMKKKFCEAKDIVDIFMLVNKPYILVVLKWIINDISCDELAKVLNSYWVCIEQISLDVNVSRNDIIKMYKKANKNILMDKEERKSLKSMQDEVYIYRGVTPYNIKQKKAVSWTLDYEVAKWFSNRFSQDGEVWKRKISKKDILCFYKKRKEQEVIVDLSKYNDDDYEVKNE